LSLKACESVNDFASLESPVAAAGANLRYDVGLY
jgi:hypothetical protein